MSGLHVGLIVFMNKVGWNDIVQSSAARIILELCGGRADFVYEEEDERYLRGAPPQTG